MCFICYAVGLLQYSKRVCSKIGTPTVYLVISCILMPQNCIKSWKNWEKHERRKGNCPVNQGHKGMLWQQKAPFFAWQSWEPIARPLLTLAPSFRSTPTPQPSIYSNNKIYLQFWWYISFMPRILLCKF